ncbi:amidohydrolase [Tsukamurella soli]|uniref:M20 family metallopeptidase n=1 Tax=Tsukamurella soli TaxID=644556 RepID=A0ABP8JJP7_9ACTN
MTDAQQDRTDTGVTAATEVLAALPTVRGWQEDLYRDLHRHPELSHHETRTAGIVAERLRTSGFDVHEGLGGTGVVGILRSGDGPTVLLRADMDALPVTEQTGLDYASRTDGVMHACGHDTHVTCLLGAAALLASARDRWSGRLVTVFQPAEEVGGGAQSMVDDGLVDLVGRIDVALGQHVVPGPAGVVATRPGPAFAASDVLRVTVYGRGGHGSMPDRCVDPVVLAAMIVIRLQTIVSREVSPTETAVVTVGRIVSGTKANVIGDHAVLDVNVRSYSEETRARILAAIRRIVVAECQASDSPREPDIEPVESFPVTDNDPDVTKRVADAFTKFFAERAIDLPQVPASEDFGDIPKAFGAPYSYWGFGGIDWDTYARAMAAGTVASDIPANHAPTFAPVVQPTLDTGTQALVVAALSWL